MASKSRLIVKVSGGIIAVLLVAGCSAGRSPNLGAAAVIQDGLRSPSSYSEISSSVVWSGKNKDSEESYIVKVTYDAQNGFGATIRDCQYVAFNFDKEGKVRWFRNSSNDSCSDANVAGEEMVLHTLKTLNNLI